jgi:uncharacterized protein
MSSMIRLPSTLSTTAKIYGEQRLILFGIERRLLVVAHTLRGDKVRIIFARGAEPHERRKYYEENS